MDLEGTTILLTGSNRGIGHAILSRLAQEPVRLLAGVRELERHAAPDPAGTPQQAEILPVRVDLSSAASIEESCAELGEHLDAVDVLINNAGEFVGGTVEQLDVEAMYATVQANLTGLMHLTRRVLPGMLARENGKIVNQGSIIADLEFPGTGVYATKAGVSSFTESLRRELEETNVTTLEIITGGYDTDMLRKAAEQLEPHTDTSSWEWQDPGDWAEKIVEAIRSDKERLEPGGKSQLGRLAAKAPQQVLDSVAKRAFER